MLFQDSSCTAAASFREFKEKGLYTALQAEGSAVLAMSGRCKVEIKGVDAWNGLDAQLCETLCRNYREAVWAVPGVQGLTDPASGVHMAAVCLHTRERFKAFTIFFRRSQPFSAAELSGAKGFMDLYCEKALLSSGLHRASEYIGLINAGNTPCAPAGSRVFIRAFGRFDVFVDNRLVDISCSKAKELLALCVDHWGGDVTMEEAIDKLWENRAYDQRSKNLYRKTVSYLHHLFASLGCPQVFASARGRCHLNRELVDCDYFRYLEGEPVHFTGEYLSHYAWAEETNAWLARRQAQG